MCGRAYSTYTDAEIRAHYHSKRPIRFPELKPNFNLSPTQEALVLHAEKAEPEGSLFRWGLIPFWAKDVKIGYKMINARAETITEKPSFKKSFASRRCIVPLSGFFEWKREGKIKRPFAIHGADAPILSMAGIWDAWKDPAAAGKVLRTFSIITTEANSLMAPIHDRMPVILGADDEEAWLDPDNANVESLKKLLKPCPSGKLRAYEISTLVNSPKNNRPEVLQPLSDAPEGAK